MESEQRLIPHDAGFYKCPCPGCGKARLERDRIAAGIEAVAAISADSFRSRLATELHGILSWAQAHEHAASDMHDDYNRGYGMACREVVAQIEKLLK